jgi:hypothetical protein
VRIEEENMYSVIKDFFHWNFEEELKRNMDIKKRASPQNEDALKNCRKIIYSDFWGER